MPTENAVIDPSNVHWDAPIDPKKVHWDAPTAQPPSTWDKIVDVGENIGGGIGRGALAAGENVVSAADILLGGLASAGGDVFGHPEWGDRFSRPRIFCVTTPTRW